MIPVTGAKPGTRVRYSRGYAVTGVAHAVQAEQVECRQTVQTVCGRTIRVYGVWSAEAWPKMVAQAVRLPHHEVGTCRKCVKLSAS